ncbi:MAG: hypothetical protein II849_04445 [Bacteroidales bacterium]|nr:hypothetical protein [Bacteroidales bacterium]
MKRILMMAFVATSMLLATSCSKDDEQKVFSGDSLKGTTWVANIDESTTENNGGQEMTMSIKGKMSITFNTETAGTATADIVMSSTYMGQSFSEPTNETVDFTYTFDGSKVTITQMDEEDGETSSFDLTLNSDKTALVGVQNNFAVEFYLQ